MLASHLRILIRLKNGCELVSYLRDGSTDSERAAFLRSLSRDISFFDREVRVA